MANIIPPQRAGAIADQAGLTDESGWCPIVPATMQSRMEQDIHVLGDACIPGDMSKSAFSANSQAKVCAMAIRAALTGAANFPARLRNTCWSTLAPEDVVKIGASYEATEAKIVSVESFISQVGESPEVRSQTRAEADAWYVSIIADTSVLINFLRIDRMDLIGLHPEPFSATEHVADEISDAYPDQHTRYAAALAAGYLSQVIVNNPEEIDLFFGLGKASGSAPVSDRQSPLP